MGEKGRPRSLDASPLRFAVVASRYNQDVVEDLVAGATGTLARWGAGKDRVQVHWVPGSFEIPVLALALARSGRFDAIVALGCVIKGETAHFEHVAEACAQGLLEVSLKTGVPCAFGVLTTFDRQQAVNRAGADSDANKGSEAAEAAIETATLLRQLRLERSGAES